MMGNIKIFHTAFAVVFCLFTFHAKVCANISVAAIFGDHMVMQKEAEVTLWGWGKPQEAVCVLTSWSADTLHALVDNQANWSIVLNTPEAGGPHTIRIHGYNTLQINDVLIGEVWLLSGQSNMEWSARLGIDKAEEAVSNAIQKEIRFFSVVHRSAAYPNYDVDGQWVVCSPETMIDFSALGYFFGKKLNDILDVPVGLINASWGGTPIEVWIPEEGIINKPELLKEAQSIPEMLWSPREPGRVYNAMIAPILSFTITGTLWYQGETNTVNPKVYTAMLSELVKGWRIRSKSDFPFIYAQIAPYNNYAKNTGVEVREAQRRALSIPKTSMVVLSDIGDTVNIHPSNKCHAGFRFADLALNRVYHKMEFPSSGPLFDFVVMKGHKVEVHFEYAKGLYDAGDALKQFEIMDDKGHWFGAKAMIKNERIILSSSKVKTPIHVRFAWRNTATPKLLNGYGLPASTFSTNPDMD